MLFGGNKTRHNEFLLADALQKGADVLVWGAGVQSNNCRQTAAACTKLGLECHLYLSRAAHNDDVQGNLLLDHLMGAQVHIIDVPMGPELDDLLLAKAEELRKAGRRPYVWDRITGRPLRRGQLRAVPGGDRSSRRKGSASSRRACTAPRRARPGPAWRWARRCSGLPGKVRLICPIRWPWDTPADIAEVANQTAALLGLPHRLTARRHRHPRRTTSAPATAPSRPAAARRSTCWRAPRASCSTRLHRQGDGRPDRRRPPGPGRAATRPLVFLHTGGTPAVFAYRDELMESKQG